MVPDPRTRHRPGAAAILAAALLTAACDFDPPSEAATSITIATGDRNAVYYPLGRALADSYTASIPGVNARAEATGASPVNVDALEEGTADVAFALGDIAYRAYMEGTPRTPRPHTRLRGIAVLYPNVLHVIVRQDSAVRRIRDLEGRRIGIGRTSAGGSPAPGPSIDVITAAHGVDPARQTTAVGQYADVVKRLGDGTLDAGFLSGGYPFGPVQDAAGAFGVRVLPIDRDAVPRIRARHPFFKPVVVPAGTYPGQDHDVETVGVDNLLLCREGLPADLVYRLTKIFYESLPDLAAAHVAARLVNPEQGPSTPIPLHEGAARYYRERELFR